MPKTYNPFKMWGSYIGSLIWILVVSVNFYLSAPIGGCGFIVECVNRSLRDYIQVYVGVAVIGFLIGWGIHSLVRALRK